MRTSRGEGLAVATGCSRAPHVERVEYVDEFYGQDGRGCPVPEAITVDALLGILDRLPPGIPAYLDGDPAG